MCLKIGLFAILKAGIRVTMNIPTNAENSHAAISSTVKMLTKGLAISITRVTTIPKETPMPNPDRRIIEL